MLDFFKKHWKDLLLILFVGIIIILICSTTCTNRKLVNAETNIKALTDSVRVYQLANGELLSAKQTLILENDELYNFLEISKKEKKEIEKKLNSQISYISELKSKIKIDTLILRDSVYITEDKITNIKFNYNDKWVAINGVTELRDTTSATTKINNINVDVPLKVGLTEDNQFFATSSNPYVSIGDIQGAKILSNKNKQKRWGIGPYIGFGVGWGYGIGFNGNTGAQGGFIGGFTVGISLHYDLLQF